VTASEKGQRVPYTQQFSPTQTPLKRLLPILRQHGGNSTALRAAIAGAFFKSTTDPKKIAGNTMIALRAHGIIDPKTAALTDLGNRLIALQGSEADAETLIAKNLISELDGLGIIETIREMCAANLSISLTTLPNELRQRGFQVSDNSSDLSGVLGWFRAANLLSSSYDVNEAEFERLVGAQPVVVDAMKNLTREQVAFLRAMLALNLQDWTPYNAVCKHAEGLYPGEVSFNWKIIVGSVLKPLADLGLIEFRKKQKQDQDTPGGRGGKPADIRPTDKFERQIAEPLLRSLYRYAGSVEIREIRTKPLSLLVDTIKHSDDSDARGRALEVLAIRFCQLLDLDFLGMRERDTELAAGGEIDALLHTARLVYSRW
jgi:hypothetical protein